MTPATETPPKEYRLLTMADVRHANRDSGQYWFSPDTLRFFKSRIGRTLYVGRYFITSEQGPDNIRKYTVRRARYDGSIDTVGAFQAHRTAAAARTAIRRLQQMDRLAEKGAI